MGLRWKLNPLASLRHGEKVLLFKRWIWLSARSWPTYRLFFSLPLLWEAGLYITDRRVLIVANLFRVLTQELSLWFDGRNEPGDDEIVKQVSVSRARMWGPYLELVSEESARRWWRSPQLQLRLFTRHAEEIRLTIAEAMVGDRKAE